MPTADDAFVPLEQRRFKLLKHGGRDDGANVLGDRDEDLEWANCYISYYTTVVAGGRQKNELLVGESTIVVGNLSGRKCDKRERETFRLVRTK